MLSGPSFALCKGKIAQKGAKLGLYPHKSGRFFDTLTSVNRQANHNYNKRPTTHRTASTNSAPTSALNTADAATQSPPPATPPKTAQTFQDHLQHPYQQTPENALETPPDSAHNDIETTPPADSPATSSAAADENFGFDDFVDIINPLQHIPIVGDIYRTLSGDSITSFSKVAGGGLFGGPIGFATSLVTSLIEEEGSESVKSLTTSSLIADPILSALGYTQD